MKNNKIKKDNQIFYKKDKKSLYRQRYIIINIK